MAGEVNESKWHHVCTGCQTVDGRNILAEWLAEMAADYDPQKLIEAPVVLYLHPGGGFSGAAADGWVSELKMQGKKLLARFRGLSPLAVEAIRTQAVRFASISFDVIAPTQRHYLKHVALLGGSTPAIPGLAPIELADGGPGFVWTTELLESGEEDQQKMEDQAKDKQQMYSGREMEVLATAKAAEATRELTAKTTDQAQELAALKTQLQELEAGKLAAEQQLVAEASARRDQELAAKVDKLVVGNKVLPAERDAVLQTLKALDGDEQRLAAYETALAARPGQAPRGERAPEPTHTTAPGPNTEELEAHWAENAHRLSALGIDKAMFVRYADTEEVSFHQMAVAATKKGDE